ncbi:sialidase family protein [Paenibacillus thalictri]|nr:sialidase family protein [Paenibacillus thalictri]
MPIQSTVKQYIFEDDRPFPSCHASTLIRVPGGDVLAAWFGGRHEKASDVAIWLSRRQGDVWCLPVKIADEEGIAHWNPVFYADGDVVTLFYKVGHEITDWFTRVIRSADGGVTWSEPAELVPGDIGGRGPVRNKPIRLAGGTLLAPASIERPNPEEEGKQIWEAFIDISADGGRTWSSSGIVPMQAELLVGSRHSNAKGFIQPTLWSPDGKAVHMLLRSTEGAIYRSDSADGGCTWSAAYATPLPNNNSGIDAVLMDGGLLALVYNPVSGYSTRAPRTPLVVAFSRDNGLTWQDEVVLEDEPGEYSYPAVIADNNELYITYTWKRERIAFWTIRLQP